MSEALIVGSFDGIQMNCVDKEVITADSSVVSLDVTKLRPTGDVTPVRAALIFVQAHNANYTVDGTAPSTTVGMVAVAGDVIKVVGLGNLLKFRATEQAASSSAELRVFYFK